MFDQQEIQARIDARFPGYVGVRLVEVTQEQIIGELEVRRELSTLSDTLHGGAIMAFGDTLGAVGAVVNLRAGQWTVTTDSSSKFLRAPSVGTTVIGVSRPLHRGSRTMVWHTEIRGEDERLCAVVTQTQLVFDRRD